MNSECVFNGEKMTRREIEIARDAFMRGGQFAFSKIREARIGVDYNRDGEWIGLVPEAARRFPLPKVTRPRVVQDSYNTSREWRVVENRIETRRCYDDKWQDANNGTVEQPGWMPDRVKLLADLVANPTETVEE